MIPNASLQLRSLSNGNLEHVILSLNPKVRTHVRTLEYPIRLKKVILLRFHSWYIWRVHQILKCRCAGVLAGHPLDTIKVRLQAENSKYRGAWHTLTCIIKEEKVVLKYLWVDSWVIQGIGIAIFWYRNH
jgi:hypothetical protein